jgi:hypothetical protein
MIIEGYATFDAPPAWLWVQVKSYLPVPLVIALAGSALAWRKGYPSPYRELSMLAVITGFVGGVVFWLQGKGWLYHTIPLQFAALLAVMVALSQLRILCTWLTNIGALGGRRTGPIILFVTLILAISILTVTPKGYLTEPPEGSRDLSVFEIHSAPGDSIVFITADVFSSYPLILTTQREPGTRYLFSFVIPLLYSNAIVDSNSPLGYILPPELAAEEQLFAQETADDIVQNKPRLVFIERTKTCSFCRKGFSLLTWATQQESLMSALESYTRLDDIRRFAIFVRSDES